MKTIESTEPGAVERAVADIADGRGKDVVIRHDGHPVALITPFDADDLSRNDRERDPAFVASVAYGRADVADRQTISQEGLIRKLGRD